MKFIRVRNSAGVDYMEPRLLPDDDFPVGALVEALKDMLQHTPDGVFICQVWDGDEIRAFVIAFAPPNLAHVFIHQAWADETLQGTEIQDKLFLRLCLWAETLGRSELRAETKRNPEAFLRRWNFKPYSAILSFSVVDDLTEKLINAKHDEVVQKEPENGGELKRDVDTPSGAREEGTAPGTSVLGVSSTPGVADKPESSQGNAFGENGTEEGCPTDGG